jgi:membrane protein
MLMHLVVPRATHTRAPARCPSFPLQLSVPQPAASTVEWRWIAFGSAAASILRVCASLLFSWAISWLGTLDELYGSVGIMIGFMLWIWLSVTVVLIGAELDASGMEMEKDGDFTR